MPITPTYPGVYVEEISSGVHTIAGVATSITAFVGAAARGPENLAVRLFSFADYERTFGGVASTSEMSYAVQQFFDNGGSDAYVVRVTKSDAVAAQIVLLDGAGAGGKQALQLTARSKGDWANSVVADVDYDGILDPKAFNLTLTDLVGGQVETFPKVTIEAGKANNVVTVVNDPVSGSGLATAAIPVATAGRPLATGTVGTDINAATALDPVKAYGLQVSIDAGGGAPVANVAVSLLALNDPRPDKVEGLCLLLERTVNPELDKVNRGLTISCRPSSSGKGIRVRATYPPDKYPNAIDAVITFTAPAVGPPPLDAATALGLTGGVANVSRYWLGNGRAKGAQTAPVVGANGGLPGTGDLIGSEAAFSGIYALRKVDEFNLLCIPDATRARPDDPSQLDANLDPNQIFDKAMSLCLDRRAFLLIDPPPKVADVATAITWKTADLTVHERNGAAFFPRLRLPDPLNAFKPRTFAPCGVVAGVYARTDAARGVWKAPAGTDATLRGVQSLVYKLNDAENGALNILGLNCCRSFPVYGNVLWGARTLVGANDEGSEWKYVPVRRLALFLEESLYRGTQWVVFEPNDEPLWAQIRLNVGAFMHDQFLQGAFQGTSARDAYLVKCDKTTTTQSDINRGVVNVLVGFAPLKPAEFVFLKIQQLAGQIQT
jgi:Bacteriophage tail sheath protein